MRETDSFRLIRREAVTFLLQGAAVIAGVYGLALVLLSIGSK